EDVSISKNTLTGENVSATQFIDEPNKCTFASTTDNISRIRKGRRKAREEGLKKIKRSLRENVVVEIPNGKGRPVKVIQSAKLSDELGIIAQNFLTLPNKRKELTIEEKDDVARAEIDEHKPEWIEPDRIEFYKNSHYLSDKGWSSQEAETDYVRKHILE
ncbi:hypothetical protein MTR67_002755, partial [Solanum verrucosum]